MNRSSRAESRDAAVTRPGALLRPLAAIAALLLGCPAPKNTSDGGLAACGSRGGCAAGVCDRQQNRCVGCRNSGDCFSSQVCVTGSCAATTACTTDFDCTPKGQLCDLVLGRCVQCKSSAECDGGEACLGFSCTAVTSCSSTVDCKSGLQVCATASAPRFPPAITAACQDCATAADCAPGSTCYQGLCGGDPCTQTSQCQNDAKTTPAEIAGCEDHRRATDAACHAESVVLSNCVLSLQTCGVDGRTDLNATLAKCSNESAAYTRCANPP